jgi:hypothetical protein
LGESELHQTVVEMMSLISLHRILPLEDASCDDIDKVDDIDPEYCHSSCNLATSDDRESSYEKCEHNSPRVTHDHSTRDIRSSQSIGDRDDDRQDREEESAIFLSCESSIGEIELHCETCEYGECDQSKSARQTWDSVREVHCVENYDIPDDSHEYWYPVYENLE